MRFKLLVSGNRCIEGQAQKLGKPFIHSKYLMCFNLGKGGVLKHHLEQ